MINWLSLLGCLPSTLNLAWGFLGGAVVKKNPPANVEDVGQEDILEKEMETHSSNLAWEIPWIEEPGGLQFMGSQS